MMVSLGRYCIVIPAKERVKCDIIATSIRESNVHVDVISSESIHDDFAASSPLRELSLVA